jgi:hypothetical protein
VSKLSSLSGLNVIAIHRAGNGVSGVTIHVKADRTRGDLAHKSLMVPDGALKVALYSHGEAEILQTVSDVGMMRP